MKNLSVTRCQLCDKPGHLVYRCWKLTDAAYVQDVATKALDDKMAKNAERRSKKKKSSSEFNVSAVVISDGIPKSLDFDPVCFDETVLHLPL